MAKIEKVVTVTVRVEENLFDFNKLLSFQTENCIGEWDEEKNGYAIFSKNGIKSFDNRITTIYADNLEELVGEVEDCIGEEIIEVYNRRIIILTFDI